MASARGAVFSLVGRGTEPRNLRDFGARRSHVVFGRQEHLRAAHSSRDAHDGMAMAEASTTTGKAFLAASAVTPPECTP